jgi:hypothetical protein
MNRTEMMGAFRKGEGCTLSWLGTNNNCRMVFLLPDEGWTFSGRFGIIAEYQRISI